MTLFDAITVESLSGGSETVTGETLPIDRSTKLAKLAHLLKDHIGTLSNKTINEVSIANGLGKVAQSQAAAVRDILHPHRNGENRGRVNVYAAKRRDEIARINEVKRLKRLELEKIIRRLGMSATPCEIREEAYRVGFGQVSSAMLMAVRNSIAPKRIKRAAGNSKNKGVINPGDYVVEVFIEQLSCRSCGSHRTKAKYQGGSRSKVLDSDGNVTHQIRVCKNCNYESVIPWNGKPFDSRGLIAKHATMKACSICKKMLGRDAYGTRSPKTPDLWKPACRQCVNARSIDAEFMKLLSTYGITKDEYDATLILQQNRCAICNKEGRPKKNGTRRLVLDHCHATGKFRGLLCDKCNLGIGHFEHDISLFAKASNYINSFYRTNQRKEVHHGSS